MSQGAVSGVCACFEKDGPRRCIVVYMYARFSAWRKGMNKKLE